MSTLEFLTTVHFDHGARRQLSALLAKNGARRPLVVSDPGVIRAGVLTQALESFDNPHALPIYDNVPMNPTEAAAARGAALFNTEGCDSIIGVGGGATLDLAKAIAILVRNPSPLWSYCNRHESPASIQETPPLLLVPTTAGTGSEVGRSAVIVFDNGIKAGVRCPNLVTAALCDPDLTFGLPPSITASTGMDALSHCIETFCSPTINPPADAISLDGMQRIFSNLKRAVDNGQDADARWNMMMGSLEGAISFQKGMGAVHALSHPLGALGFHHGTLNAILLPHVLRANAPVLEDKLKLIRTQAGWAEGSDVFSHLQDLSASIGLPLRLRDIGVKESDLPLVSRAALEDNAHKTNPRKMTADDYRVILSVAY
jgi:4-hydroxybutyrate dehydrogenase